MGTKHNFTVGDVVQSTYHGRWVAVILDAQNRNGTSPLCTVRAVLDSNGHAMHKSERSKHRQIDAAHLRHYTPRSPDEAEAIRLWSDLATKWSQLPKSVR